MIEIGTLDNDTNEEMLSVEETSRLFKVTPQTVHKWMKQGKIKYEQKTPLDGYLIPSSQFELIDRDYIKNSQKIILGDSVGVDVVNPEDVYEVYPEKKEP